MQGEKQPSQISAWLHDLPSVPPHHPALSPLKGWRPEERIGLRIRAVAGVGLLQGLTEVLPAGSCTSEPATPFLPPCLPLLSWPVDAWAPPLPWGSSLNASRNLGGRSSECLSLLPCGTPHLLPKGLPAAACFICNRPPSYGHKWPGPCRSVSVVAGFVCLCLLLVSPPSSLTSEPKKPHSCDSGPSPLPPQPWPLPGTPLSTRMWKMCPWACAWAHTHTHTRVHTHIHTPHSSCSFGHFSSVAFCFLSRPLCSSPFSSPFPRCPGLCFWVSPRGLLWWSSICLCLPFPAPPALLLCLSCSLLPLSRPVCHLSVFPSLPPSATPPPRLCRRGLGSICTPACGTLPRLLCPWRC